MLEARHYTRKADMRQAGRRLRSADTRTRTDLGDRALCAAGPRIWNNLSTDLRYGSTCHTAVTEKSLTTFLFRQWITAQPETV